MVKYTWSGGISEGYSIEVIACRDHMTEQPKGLVINRDDFSIDINADERFMVTLKIYGDLIATLHPHEVVNGEINKDLTSVQGH